MNYISTTAVVSIFSLLALSCTSNKTQDDSMDTTTSADEESVSTEMNMVAVAAISSASGSRLSGEANFEDNGDGTVTFSLSVMGATPGTHAIHLHTNGDCSAADATSAGGHWNPSETDHGKREESASFHAGDIDNLEVGADSTGTLIMTVNGWSVGGPDSTNVIGKAIIIHAAADDFISQPSGAAGPRVGCGVVTEE